MALQTIIDWNENMLDAIRAGSTNPPVASRAMAITQAAVFDALNAINGSLYEGYATRTTVATGINEDAAAISASYNALKILFPSFASELQTRYDAAISALGSASGVSEGVALGAQTAAAAIALRTGDGSTATVSYTPGTDVGDWQPTPTGFANALLPQWANLKPFTMISSDQFRPSGPPAVDSSQYTTAYNEVKAIGSSTSTTRTAEQTEIAQFWADGGGTETPPGHWNSIAQTVALAQDLSMVEAARLFALLNLGAADAGIAAWNTKYTYDNWRPVTGIRNGDSDGNPDTAGDSAWTPLISTPPFPDYISGHSTYSATAARILEYFLGTGDFEFSSTSDGLTSVTRDFDSFWDAAQEAAVSRLYGGIHWRFSNVDGLEVGENIARHVDNYFLLRQNVLTSGNDVATVVGDRSTRAQGGNDSVTGSEGIDRIFGGVGNDTIKAGAEADMVFGGDALSDATLSHDVIWGGTGADTLLGNAGEDVLYGESSAGDSTDAGDYIHGGGGYDALFGNAENDTLYGSAHGDTVFGGDDDDLIFGGNGAVDGNDGADVLYGDDGADTIYGNSGNDVIYGGTGIGQPSDNADIIYGGSGNDTIYGNGGADSIAGGSGNDVFYGGNGNDVFLIGNNNGRDIIYGFAGAGEGNGDVLHILSSINGSGVTTADQILLITETEGGDAIIWFDPTNNVTVAGGAGLATSDIVMVTSESF